MSTLRSFKVYGRTTLYCPIRRGGMSASGPVIPCNLVNLSGYSSAAGVWLQMFDSLTTPLAGAVPLKSINVSAIGPLPDFSQTVGPTTFFKGMWFGLSSTEGTYTADASAHDLWGEVEEWEGVNAISTLNLTTVSDVAVSKLQVWADSAGPKTLYAVDVDNQTGGDCYVMVFAKDNPADGDKEFVSSRLLTDSVHDVFFYGEFSPLSIDSGTTTRRDGCTIMLSSTGNVLTATAVGSTILAHYK